jgi:epoxide hydrolase-like predicted phosphatase
MVGKQTIRNIVFDLGGVILDIDISRTVRAFARLTSLTEEEILEKFATSRLFARFETGELDVSSFRDLVRELAGIPMTDAVIDMAWNILLLDVPPERIRLIKRLREKYRIFLLSNTSSIHIEEVNLILRRNHQVDGLGDLFEHVFLSYEMGVMKPDAKIYSTVLSAADLVAEETLFLDDNEENVISASQLGIQTIHVNKPLTILDYLEEYAD